MTDQCPIGGSKDGIGCIRAGGCSRVRFRTMAAGNAAVAAAAAVGRFSGWAGSRAKGSEQSPRKGSGGGFGGRPCWYGRAIGGFIAAGSGAAGGSSCRDGLPASWNDTTRGSAGAPICAAAWTCRFWFGGGCICFGVGVQDCWVDANSKPAMPHSKPPISLYVTSRRQWCD